MAQRAYHDRRRRVAELVEDPSGDRAAAWEGHVQLLEDLTGGQLQRFAALERTPLPVFNLEVAALRDAEGVAAWREILELPPTVRIGSDPAAQTLCRIRGTGVDDVDECAAQRLPGVAGEDAAADAGSLGGLRGGVRWPCDRTEHDNQ